MRAIHIQMKMISELVASDYYQAEWDPRLEIPPPDIMDLGTMVSRSPIKEERATPGYSYPAADAVVPPERAQLPRGVPHLGAVLPQCRVFLRAPNQWRWRTTGVLEGRTLSARWDDDSDKGSRTDEDDFDDDDFLDTAENIDDRRKKTDPKRGARHHVEEV